MPFGIPTKKVEEPEEDPDPPCTDCPHSAMSHNGDGWGTDERGPFDWFLCQEADCDCRVKGHLHITESNLVSYTSPALPGGPAVNPYGVYAGLI